MTRDVKKELLNATIRLIQQKGSDPAVVTVRDICREAGAGVSQINYHFQTKQNLIEHCVQVMIGSVIDEFARFTQVPADKPAMEVLKDVLKKAGDFLYENENISRLSIIADMQRGGRPGDNTQRAADMFIPLVRAVCDERVLPHNAEKYAILLVLTLQGAFLRTDVMFDETGVNLRDAAQRLPFTVEYVDRLLS